VSTLQQPADIPEEHPPTEWARLAITAYATHGADRIAMADANCTNPRCDGAPAITVVQPAANIALSGARATRDARDASAFGALVSPYEKFESISEKPAADEAADNRLSGGGRGIRTLGPP
jgi:hypothetical protein